MTSAEVAQRHGFSPAAGNVALAALRAGGGTMAQFNHPELGGPGQWLRGGMLMIGDGFNAPLKARVAALFAELSGLPAETAALPPLAPLVPTTLPPLSQGSAWWPAALGSPASTGAQGAARYAWFPGAGRLAVEEGGRVTVYRAEGLTLTGFGQQQSSAGPGEFLLHTSAGPVPVSALSPEH